jgi:hypothetical protein
MGGGGMSKRRKAKEIVWKKENAGFVGRACLVQIIPEDEEKYGVSYCMLDCGDPECREWATCWACDKDGNPTGGMACHVSECQMEDV